MTINHLDKYEITTIIENVLYKQIHKYNSAVDVMRNGSYHIDLDSSRFLTEVILSLKKRGFLQDVDITIPTFIDIFNNYNEEDIEDKDLDMLLNLLHNSEFLVELRGLHLIKFLSFQGVLGIFVDNSNPRMFDDYVTELYSIRNKNYLTISKPHILHICNSVISDNQDEDACSYAQLLKERILTMTTKEAIELDIPKQESTLKRSSMF